MNPRPIVAALALGAACSTVKPDREVSCIKTEDCRTGEVCQNGECYPNTLPPPEQVGLDVTVEGTFRVELPGADKIVERVVEQSPARFRARLNNAKDDADNILPGVRDRLRISIRERKDTPIEADKEKPLTATLALEQASRLRRDPVRGQGTYSPYDVDKNELLNAEVVVPWPRYDPADSADALHLTIRPPLEETDDSNNMNFRGTIHRQLMRKELGEASTQVFDVPTRYECHRKIIGEIVVGDGAPLESRVSVDFVHTHSAPDPGKSVCDPSTAVQAVCEPSTVYPNDLPSCTTANDCPAPYGCYTAGSSKRCGCASDDECQPGQICELESHRCAYDLLGLSATNGAVYNTDNESTLAAWIYSYCDENVDEDREMAFHLRASAVGLDDGDEMTPLPLSRLPPLTYAATANVFASLDDTLQLPGRLCFPQWDAPHALTVDFTSKPREVFRDDMDRPWICCSTDCLGMMLPEPPAVPATCPLTGALTPRTLYTPDEVLQDKHGCLGLADLADGAEPGSQWIVGTRVELGACVDGGGSPAPCNIALSPGDGAREYELRLEPAVGSLVRSTLYTAEVKPDTVTLPPPELAYRVLLRGGVALEVDPEADGTVCDGVIDCEVKAEILAERIRLPEEDPRTVLGPFFYTTRTIEGSTTGEFVLPVNPGVYLLTALPAISSPGGPAKIAVVDLRLDSKLVKTVGEIPTATLEDPLLLPQKGQFVIFELASFDLASVATPFDLGSWTGLTFEGRELDLNDPATCHGDPGRACSIRRLRAGNSGLALTQEQFVKFITRPAPDP